MDEHDEAIHAEMKERAESGEFTADDKYQMVRIAMKTADGKQMLRRAFRKYMTPERAAAVIAVMDGEIEVENFEEFIENSVLDAMSARTYTQEDAAKVLGGHDKPLTLDDIEDLKRKHGQT